ncbi:MAG: cysteine desulfurase family protein [Bacteroidetes bacterium]|nr:cysteine desulfurase family protein [Bacteroidota bacterium]
MRRIYLDNAASTPVDPQVLEILTRTSLECYGNASSMHSDGTRAKELLEYARSGLASVVNCHPEELYFTSGGTEANNWALKGFCLANRSKGNHIIISSIEHDCILNSCRWLQKQGFIITIVPVDGFGITQPDILERAISDKTILVSVMHVNNELGTIQPIAEIGRIAHEKKVAFHTDACQSFGKIPLDAGELAADMISINAHKIYGPKGVGALFIRKGTDIEPLLHGGGQEQGIRSTTENIPGITAFVKAAEVCHSVQFEEQVRIDHLSGKLRDNLFRRFENVYFNGSPEHNIPGIVNFSFSGQEGQAIRLLLMLDEEGISVSAGSACSSNHEGSGGSHVLRAIGRDPVESRGAVRVSIGRYNTESDIEQFCDSLTRIMQKLNPIYSF